MGQVHAITYHMDSEWAPDPTKGPTFPANFGFEQQGYRRKERVLDVSQQELIAFKVPLRYRDFCVHKYIEFYSCHRANMPWFYKCGKQKIAWEECEKEDVNMSRKEYEREQRLLLRQQRKERLAKLKEERQEFLARVEEAQAESH